MSDSITFENHGVTLGLSRGKNLGVTIMAGDKMMNAQLEDEDVDKLLDWLVDTRFNLVDELHESLTRRLEVKEEYRDFHIHDVNVRFEALHKDFKGSDDSRYFFGLTADICKQKIDEWYENR